MRVRDHSEIILRLPLFFMFLVLLGAGIRLLVQEFRGESRADTTTGEASEAMPPAP